MKKIILLALLFLPLAAAFCQYPNGATATSENNGAFARYALGLPDASYMGDCTRWSSSGYSWNPANWDVKANITLSYVEPVYVRNMTIFGDFDMCWDRGWLVNSGTGEMSYVHNSPDNSCVFRKNLDGDFFADTLILETCGWAWSSTDSVQICGDREGRNESSNSTEQNISLSVNKKVYLVPYLGDFDGSVSEDWFAFYNTIVDFHEQNNIPLGVSFYPGSMSNNSEFSGAVRKMYESGNFELIQKGNNGSYAEYNSHLVSIEQQREVAGIGQNNFIRYMESLGFRNVRLPTAYNLIRGRFTTNTMIAIAELGFKQYLDVYYDADVGTTDSTSDFDVIQYGVSFTSDGRTGANTSFKSVERIYTDINNFQRSDVSVKMINDTQVIPIWVHQQDFENVSGGLNQTKWDRYREVMLRLKNDSNVTFLLPEQSYNMSRVVRPDNVTDRGDDVCLYPNRANASSENTGALARYLIGLPNAPYSGNCSRWSGAGYSWNPTSWNMKANVTVGFAEPLYVKNMTIFGDYDVCWDRAWLLNSYTGRQVLVHNTPDNSCTFRKSFDIEFFADSVILETCGWAWSSTDSIQICGSRAGGTNLSSNEAEICTWKNCEKGAVSISVDDFYTSCMSELEENGFRGTYFLSNTYGYSTRLWSIFDAAYKRGHEIGTHTRDHRCVARTNETYIQDLEQNIVDIENNTDIRRESIISHAHPCGFVTDTVRELTSNVGHLISARGYNMNLVEEQTPADFWNIKSINSDGYPGGSLSPPDYYQLIQQAEEEGKWLNFVFHNECNDRGIISHLSSREIWVDTIGNVVQYIKLRDASRITSYEKSGGEVRMTILTNSSENLRQSISVKVPVERIPSSVTVNGRNADYRYFSFGQYVILNIEPSRENNIVIR
jgi:hypothetical protein